MQNYYEDLSKFEAVEPEDKKTVLKIFDFDGTIFNSPLPNKKIWDRKIYGKLWSDFSMGGYGWFQNTLTLDDKYVQGVTFNKVVVDEVNKSMTEPDSVTVLLTGRTDAFTGQIKKLVDDAGMEFEEYGLKPRSDFNPELTFGFKTRYINELIAKYNPVKIEMWEDRPKHAQRFKELLDTIGIDNEIHEVTIPETASIIDPALERELVSKLIADPRAGKKQAKKFNQQHDKKQKKEKKPSFWGAYLDSESYNKVLQEIGSEIPDNWKKYLHHMTITLGTPKTDPIKSFIEKNRGKVFELNAVALGKSDEAMALKIDSDVPTKNEIPHITVAVSPTGKPVKSNFITDWKPLPNPIKLSAKIGAEY